MKVSKGVVGLDNQSLLCDTPTPGLSHSNIERVNIDSDSQNRSLFIPLLCQSHRLCSIQLHPIDLCVQVLYLPLIQPLAYNKKLSTTRGPRHFLLSSFSPRSKRVKLDNLHNAYVRPYLLTGIAYFMEVMALTI